MFWDNFYNACLAKGVKPTNLVQELGLARASVTPWKNGKIPNGEALIKIANRLEVSIDYLLGLTDNPDTSVNNSIVIGHDNSEKLIVNSDIQSNDNAIVEIETIISRLTGASRYRAIADVLEVLEKYA